MADLLEKSPVAMRISKALMNRPVYIDGEARLEPAMLSGLINNGSKDYREGIKAFNEKRKPVFRRR